MLIQIVMIFWVNTVYLDMWMPTFQRNTQPPNSKHELEAVYFSKTLAPTNLTSQ